MGNLDLGVFAKDILGFFLLLNRGSRVGKNLAAADERLMNG